MSLELSQIKLSTPQYFHRAYQNDLAKKDSKDSGTCNQLLRVAQVSLAFVALYKPFGRSLAFLMGGSRALSCLSKTYNDIAEGKNKVEIASDMLQTVIAITSFAGTIFAHPLGMLITTCHDLGNNVFLLRQAWVEKDSAKALESGLQILNNSVYLSMFFVGSTEVLVASLALQILSGLYQSSSEFKKGNYMEVGAGVLMATIRANQCANAISILQARWKIDTFVKRMGSSRAIEECNTAKLEITYVPQLGAEKKTSQISPSALDVIIKYGPNPKGISPLHYAIEKRDFSSAEILINEGLYLETVDFVVTVEDKIKHSATPAIVLAFIQNEVKEPNVVANCDRLLKLCCERINPHLTFECITRQYIKTYNGALSWKETGKAPINQAHYLISHFSNRVHHHYMIDILWKRGVNLNIAKNLVLTQLYRGDIEAVKFFIERGYEIKDQNCLAPLIHYIEQHNPNSYSIIEMIKYLQSVGLNINKSSDSDKGMSQLDAFFKKIVSISGVSTEFKQQLIPFLLSLGAKT